MQTDLGKKGLLIRASQNLSGECYHEIGRSLKFRINVLSKELMARPKIHFQSNQNGSMN